MKRWTYIGVIFLLLIITLFSLDSKDGETSERMEKELEVESLFLPADVSEERTEPITHIVLHFSSNAGIDHSDPHDVHAVRQIFIDYGVSSHYIIDRDGTIYELVSNDRVAYHAGKGRIPNEPQYTDRLNHYSIGIELLAIGTKEEMASMIDEETYDKIAEEHLGYTDEQYDALDALIDVLVTRHPQLEKTRNHIIGHDEYAPDRKTDPGSLFDWGKIELEK
ncbi:MAG TPA: N-acetylmuramoyl-L-alanine amidase [Pseudogracilibacillus sp.]|nr:N-acetylmuramoyl-L-alanine amidase [Pseudogracilibacillus sp.]